jgi:three-Cys-motif partner protein
VETRAINGEFEHHIDEILDFVSSGFAFFFIDPTGWGGYPLKTIASILRYQPGEVLINFMTQHISRFVDSTEGVEAFRGLFGSLEVRERWEGLSGLDREDEIVQAYCDRVKEVGQFEFVGTRSPQARSSLQTR